MPRCAWIRYQDFDESGQMIDWTTEGFDSRVVHYECALLLSKLFLMRMADFSRFGCTDVLFPELNST